MLRPGLILSARAAHFLPLLSVEKAGSDHIVLRLGWTPRRIAYRFRYSGPTRYRQNFQAASTWAGLVDWVVQQKPTSGPAAPCGQSFLVGSTCGASLMPKFCILYCVSKNPLFQVQANVV